MYEMKSMKFNTNRLLFKLFSLCLLPGICVIPLLHCDTVSDQLVEISFVSDLSEKRYVAYPSFDRFSKPDTVTASWNFTGTDGTELVIDLSIDSGNTWFVIDSNLTITPSTLTLRWVPGDDPILFSYFGEKEAMLRVYDSRTTRSSISGTFSIIGSIPVELEQGFLKSAPYSINDTITLFYHVNTDLISRIRTFFRNDVIEEWIEFTKTIALTDNSTSPFESYTARFIPLEYDTLIANHPDQPVIFMLKDYNSPLPSGTVISSAVYFTESDH